MWRAATHWKEGTRKIYTHLMESIAKSCEWHAADPRIDALVNELIGNVADKWTMILLETLEQHGELRFTQLSKLVPDISQKMLTQTLRRMERDGMVTRTVHAVVPPRVDYRLTPVGESLGEAFCGVWRWAEANLETVTAARAKFDTRDR